MMGLIGLVSASFFPLILRISHTVEIFFDALVYAGVLVALFIPKLRHEVNKPVVATAD